MTQCCDITGKGPMTGYNVSHSNRKTKRRFMPNIQPKVFYSETLGRVRLKVSMAGLRTVEKAGGLDEFLQTQSAHAQA